MKRYSSWGHDGSFRFKWQAKRWSRKNKHLILLGSIANSLKVIEESIDISTKNGNAIRTISAMRY